MSVIALNLRRSPRRLARFELFYNDGTAYSAGIVTDISESGLLLENVLPLRIGTIVRLLPSAPFDRALFQSRAREEILPRKMTRTTAKNLALGARGSKS